MPQIVSLLVAVLISIVAGPLWAAPNERDALVREVMRLSGLEQQVRAIPQQVLSGFEKDGKKLPPAQYQRLRRSLARAFHAPTLETQVYEHLRKDLDPVVAKKSLEWLRSDLGRRITKLEEAAATVQGLKGLQAYAERLKSSPPSQERLMLARQVDFASHATETHIDILEATTFSIAAAFDATLPADQRQGQERLRIIMDRQRPKWREASQEQTLVMLLYTYQSLTDQELERYVEFLENDVGRQYQAAATGALRDALYAAIDRMAQSLVDVMKPAPRRKVT